MKRIIGVSAFLMAVIICASAFVSCSTTQPLTNSTSTTPEASTPAISPEPSVTEGTDDKVTPEGTVPGTTAAPATTSAPATEPPKDQPVINPDLLKPSVMPSEIYELLTTKENVCVGIYDNDDNYELTIYKDGNLIELYEKRADEKYEQYYDLEKGIIYYLEEGKMYASQTDRKFKDILELYLINKNSEYFNDSNYSKYDMSFSKYHFSDSLLDQQNGKMWAYMQYPYEGEHSSYVFHEKIVDRGEKLYEFGIDTEYQATLPTEYEWR